MQAFKNMKLLDLKEYIWSLYDQLSDPHEKERFYNYSKLLLNKKLSVGECYQHLKAIYERFSEERQYLNSESRVQLNRLKTEKERYYFLYYKKQQLFAQQNQGRRSKHKTTKLDDSCLNTLGLSYPCPTGDIKKAYRHLVKQYHPDYGGEQSEFIAIKQAYQEALELCIS